MGHRGRRTGSRRAHRADQREYPLVLNQLPGVDKGAVGFVAVVAPRKSQPAAVDPAGLISFIERGLDAKAHSQAQFPGRPSESGGLPELDLAGGYAGNARVFVVRGAGSRRLPFLSNRGQGVNFAQQLAQNFRIGFDEGSFGNGQFEPLLQAVKVVVFPSAASSVTHVFGEGKDTRPKPGNRVFPQILDVSIHATRH